jgi:hypothetical protein
MAVLFILFCLVAISLVIARRRERLEGCFTPAPPGEGANV